MSFVESIGTIILFIIVIALILLFGRRTKNRPKNSTMSHAQEQEYRILEVLSKEKELFGMQIIERDPNAGERGVIYITLGRMEKEGLLSSREEPGELPDPAMLRRRLYAITRRGRLQHQLRS